MALQPSREARSDLLRLFAVSFAADFELYIILTAVPFKALALGADPLQMGVLASASPATYAVLAAVFGRLSDRVPRLTLARASCAGLIVACIGLTLASSVLGLIAWIPFVGGSLSLFWPSIQASLADRSRLQDLERTLGRFNLAWSLGKSTGFLLGGLVVTSFGAETTFTLASAVSLAIFLALPPARRAAPSRTPWSAAPQADAAAASTPFTPEEDPALDTRAPRFRRMAWAANSMAYGLGATLVYHYPRIVELREWSPRTFGGFLGLVYLTQTLAFVVLMRRPGAWRFKRGPLYAPQILMAVAVVSLPFADVGRLLASALLFGAGLGVCYFSSIYYSLHTHERRGRNAGLHEALIGAGSMLVPLAGGFMARQLDRLWMPFAVAAAAVLASVLVQEMFHGAAARARSRNGDG